MSASPISPGGARPKVVNRPRAILLLAALVALTVLLLFGLESLFNPWSVSLTGAPTLTGKWQGEMTTASGGTYRVDLSVERDIPADRCINCAKIKGEVRTCETGGECRTYRIWGNVNDRRGTSFLLKTLDETEHTGKLTLGVLEGRWPGGDTLALTTWLHVAGASVTTRIDQDEHGRERLRVIGGHPDAREPVQWNMTRRVP